MAYLLGVDIGPTKTAVVLGSIMEDGCGRHGSPSDDMQVNIDDRIQYLTEAGKDPSYMLSKIAEGAQMVMDRNGISVSAIHAAGLVCGGVLELEKGVVVSYPGLCGWENVPVVKVLENKIKVRMRLLNDANACALAEWRFGNARGSGNIIFLTFGPGLRAGMIMDGKLYEGANGMAGEIGHIRLERSGPVGYGKAGSLEGFCSSGGIAQLARTMALETLQSGEKVAFIERGDIDRIDARMVAEAAVAGDKLACEVFNISGMRLGAGLAILMDLLNPEVIVIGGLFARYTGLFKNAMMDELEKEALAASGKACRILPAGLRDQIGDYAALAAALYDR